MRGFFMWRLLAIFAVKSKHKDPSHGRALALLRR
jgi:hypothetical protein